MSVVWKVKKWEELNKQELYEILRLRSEIFIVEQECPYQDIDNKDIFSKHYFGKINSEDKNFLQNVAHETIEDFYGVEL